MITRFFYNTSITLLLLFCVSAKAQNKNYTFYDTLKGTITDFRKWWDVTHYDLHVSFNYKDSSIKGYNKITYRVLEDIAHRNKLIERASRMQIDLDGNLKIDSLVQDSKKCVYLRTGDSLHQGNIVLVILKSSQSVNEQKEIFIYYHGKPHAAKNAPWDGGVIWAKDSNKNPWISIACQGMAGSAWYPCKDHQSDEPDSASVFITAPEDLITVSNGRLRSKKINEDGTSTYNWAVVNPINNYNIIPYIGKYVNFSDTLNGKGGVLSLNFWALEENLEKAKKQFTQVKPMLRCFEDWFGKYPFYEDGYKLVEAPFLGMEHQSAVAYGNGYINGYKGRDLSSTGWGLKWDFIIVHESGHEWFGNNITVKDVADNWVHEGFTAYSENLYTEYLYGKKAGAEYVIGTRSEVKNDEPIIADYNVNRDGSGDMYYKAANMLHTIRNIVNNDSLWKETLRGLNKTFWHQTVTTKQIEDYLIVHLKKDLQKIFDQYLRTIKIPELEYKVSNGKLSYRWVNCVKGFNMPLKINDGKKDILLQPSEKWQTLNYVGSIFNADNNFYITTKEVSGKESTIKK